MLLLLYPTRQHVERATSILVSVALATTIACEPLLQKLQDAEHFAQTVNRAVASIVDVGEWRLHMQTPLCMSVRACCIFWFHGVSGND